MKIFKWRLVGEDEYQSLLLSALKSVGAVVYLIRENSRLMRNPFHIEIKKNPSA